jgi:glycerol-3-phosphate dehydrogenase
VRNDIAAVIPVPHDKRSLFVVPWGRRDDGTFEHTYVGTTDTDYNGPLDDPQCTQTDIEYVLRALNASITTGVTTADVTGAWAGLRPLVKSAASGRTADLSRRHKVTRSDGNLISVTGGKLTTYREMAEDTVDVVCDALGRRSRAVTKRLPLDGAEGFDEATEGRERHLANRYGGRAGEIESLMAADPSLAEPLVAGLPYVKAEAIYAARAEMVTTLDDVLSRRTRARLFDRSATLAAADDVARLIAPELGWDAGEIERQVAAFAASCAAEENAAITPESALLGGVR